MTNRLCHCGTCDEAWTTALRTYKQIRENQCPTWAFQVASALIILSVRELECQPVFKDEKNLSAWLGKTFLHHSTRTHVDECEKAALINE